MLRKNLRKFFCEIKKYSGKWLELEASTENNGDDIIRRTTSDRFYGGVKLIPIKETGNSEDLGEMILIGNYRIPSDSRVLEFPAGLAEIGLSLKENAMKELREETGVFYLFKPILVPKCDFFGRI